MIFSDKKLTLWTNKLLIIILWLLQEKLYLNKYAFFSLSLKSLINLFRVAGRLFWGCAFCATRKENNLKKIPMTNICFRAIVPTDYFASTRNSLMQEKIIFGINYVQCVPPGENSHEAHGLPRSGISYTPTGISVCQDVFSPCK